MLTDALIRGRQASRGVNGCLYTRLLSKTEELLNCVCEGPSKISTNFTLHLIKVGKMKRFKKASSDLKTILKTDLPTLVADLWLHERREIKGETRQSISSPVQTDATLLDVACCVRLHTLLHVVGCCCVLLRKV